MTFAIGAAAGIITVYATRVFDTVKTRSQGARHDDIGSGAECVQRWKSICILEGVRCGWEGWFSVVGLSLLCIRMLFY